MKAGAHEYLEKSDLSPGLLRAVVPSVLRAARAQAEEKTALERLRLAAATADIGTWDYYPESGELLLSDRARALLGILPSVAVDYKLFLSLVHAADREQVDGALSGVAAAAQGKDFQVDFRVSHGPPVGTRWLSAKGREVARSASGVAASPHVVGALVDVTERKAAERAAGERAEIVESLQRFGEALTSSIAREDIIQLATAEARRLLGADASAYVARHADVGPDARVVASAGLAPEEVDGLGPELKELPFRGGEPRATSRGMTYTGVPVVSATSGVVGGLLFGVRDRELDERAVQLARGIAGWAAVAIENARLLHAAKEARDASERAVRARDDTLAVVTHDLRNPLNTVLLTSALMLKGQIAPDEVSAQLDIIKRAGHHMERLINDLLDTSQIESGTFAVEPADLDPVPLLSEVADLFAHRVAHKGVALIVDRDVPHGLRIRGDRTRVVQALGNLVANGVKFTEAGGEVRLGLEADADAVRFVVTDSGSGVPDDELPHIFKRFWQGRPGDRAGAGLGLGIVKGIAEAHGGDVGVSTQVGEGSRFWFAMSRADAQGTAEGEASAA
jgi:signal transduction histidine kinase